MKITDWCKQFYFKQTGPVKLLHGLKTVGFCHLDFMCFRYSGSRRVDETARMEQENLDIKCLQLLRAVIHNEIVKLPSDWEENPSRHKG